MGRKSLAEQIWEKYSEEQPGDDTWLVIYDFQLVKPTTKFYNNLNRIKKLAKNGELVQFSVNKTNDIRAAKTLRDLVEHYDGKALLFKGEMIDL
jgi:hypothetical protein